MIIKSYQNVVTCLTQRVFIMDREFVLNLSRVCLFGRFVRVLLLQGCLRSSSLRIVIF